MNIKLKRLRQKLEIKVKKGNHCCAEIHNNTIFLDKKANDYDVAHEISHIICGWGCCREHCEWEAHGGAKVLCGLFGVDEKEVKDAEERMDCYAHRTNPEACGRYKEKNNWVKDVKKEVIKIINKSLRKQFKLKKDIEKYWKEEKSDWSCKIYSNNWYGIQACIEVFNKIKEELEDSQKTSEEKE